MASPVASRAPQAPAAAAGGAAPVARSRELYIDAFRGLMALVMVQGHVFERLLEAGARGETLYQAQLVFHGSTAPGFLFASGFVAGLPRAPISLRAGLRRARRLLFVFAVGYFIHLPYSSLWKTLAASTAAERAAFFVISNAETHFAVTQPDGRQKLTIWCPADDRLRQDILTRRGYQRQDWPEYQRRPYRAAPLLDAPLTSGYTIRSLGGAFHHPAMTASTSLMVPDRHLPRIAGANQTLQGLISIFAPPLGALLLELYSTQAVLLLDIGTAIIAILPLLFIPIPQPAGQTQADGSTLKTSYLQDLRAGFTLSFDGKACWD